MIRPTITETLTLTIATAVARRANANINDVYLWLLKEHGEWSLADAPELADRWVEHFTNRKGCDHLSPNFFDAHAPINDKEYQCLICGHTTTGFIEYVRDREYAPDAAPYRPNLPQRKTQAEIDLQYAVKAEMSSSLFAGFPY